MKNGIVGLGIKFVVMTTCLSVGVFQNVLSKEDTSKLFMKNQLQKVFHHEGALCNNVSGKLSVEAASTIPSVELGCIVFYFTQNQDVQTLFDELKSKNRRELVFFFPKAYQGNREVEAMMKTIGRGVQSYQVYLEEVKKPIEGIKFRVAFDPTKVDYKYFYFDKIGAHRPQPGVRFQFYNQELLNEIGSKSQRSMLNTACAKTGHDIIIDCGHGGKDFGAVGAFNLKEKDIALAVGTQAADLLKKKALMLS